ncbi:zinc finger protein 660 isoform X2 [Ceratitis capitata]|uniref:Zinc finger protein 37 n=1 Tax=Ceratitis capitata TaxID=7213 RepID=W8ASQ2_CERCA|nr:zinc finger protein 660 isoform X2 [Ceratitis capitata]
MDVEIISEKIECSDLKKCGEIATLLSVGKPEFFLNCGFCEYTFLQLDNFIAHMYNDHITEFPATELKKETTEEDEMLNECSTDTLESVAQEEYLKEFERVEIELDTSDANILNDNKECLSKEFDEQENESKATLTGRIQRNQNFQLNLNRGDEIESSEKEYKRPQEQSMRKRPSKISHNRRNAIREKYKLNKDELESQRDLEMEISEEVIDTKKYRNESDLDDTKMSNNYDETDDDDFLQDFDESEDVDEPQTKSKMKTQKRIADSVLDDKQFLILTEIYKSYTCLWNEVDIAYRFKNRREEAIKSLHEEFNSKSGLSLLQKDVEREIALLREICSIEKKEKLNSKRHNVKYRPKCPFYKNIAYIEVDVSPFECSICGKRLPALGHYKTHVASHDGSLPFKCHLCGHGFQVGANLTVHLRRHVQDYIYKCEICNKPCATTTELKIHMRSHTGEKPFICSVCGQKHGTSSHLLVHMLRHNNKRPHKCKICSKAFFESGTLKEHMMVHTKIRNIICDICHKGFKSKTHLYQHKLIHNKEKRYECNICKKRFAQPAGLSGHMKTHGTKLSANVSKINTEMNK